MSGADFASPQHAAPGGPGQRLKRLLENIPAIIVVVSLLAILLVPMLLERRTDALRTEISDRIDAARTDLMELNLEVARTESALRGWLVTRDRLLQRYHDSRERLDRLIRRVGQRVAVLGPETSEAHQQLVARIARWQRRHDAVVTGELTPGDLVVAMPELQAEFEAVMEASGELRHRLNVAETARRQQVVDLQQTAGVVTVALGLVALAAATVVFWLTRRVRDYAAKLQVRTRDEIAFRKVASSLSGATDIEEVLLDVSRSACSITGADAAYVEAVLENREEVEVVTRIGRSSPEIGLKVPYPGSLTDEVIRSGEPAVITDFADFGQAMVPYIQDRCRNCEILTVPLLGNREALGALVLIDAARSRRKFTPEIVERARVLGSIASVALRRVRLLENEKHARKEAEDAVRAREEVLAIVSHDLRSPLTTIQLSTSWLREVAPADLHQELSAMEMASGRMERMIRDLLDAVRLESGKLVVNPEPLSPAALLEDVASAHRAETTEKNLTIVVERDEDLPDVNADRDRLLQVFGNLVGNAIKFSPPRRRIVIGARATDGAVEFEVSDAGPGISQTDLPHVFDRHYQARSTAHLGTGLGLAIAKGIVESHGGTMWVESAPGEGARFLFTIPQHRPPDDTR